MLTIIFPSILIINGDFNLNLFKCGVDRSCTDYYSLRLFHNLYPLILKHTRINSQSTTLIDNIFCNNINILCHSGIVTADSSDHFAILASFKMNNHVNNSVYTEVKRRDMDKKEKNLRVLRYSLSEASWADIKNIASIDELYNCFSEKIHDIYNSSCPVGTIKIKKIRSNETLHIC